MRNDRIEWDDRKASSNLFKHGVSFEEAAAVFGDLHALIEADDSDPYEERWATIGLSLDNVLFVISTERRGNIVRIISARRATRHEEDSYYRQALPER